MKKLISRARISFKQTNVKKLRLLRNDWNISGEKNKMIERYKLYVLIRKVDEYFFFARSNLRGSTEMEETFPGNGSVQRALKHWEIRKQSNARKIRKENESQSIDEIRNTWWSHGSEAIAIMITIRDRSKCHLLM